MKIKLTFWKVVFFVIMALGIYSSFIRYFRGLGAVSNMSDQFPWGLWIGFDFLGIGLAAAGFTIVAAVHLFHAEDYEPIVRPALLTAFIGYTLVVLVLVIDLGRPDHFWHPLVMWNPHSVMFEITWCVILYTTVLSIEFAPIVLEKFNMHEPIKWIHTFSLPFMIIGVLLSTLHQSSFGSLYLIVPNRLYPLWYSPLLPIMFFVSCIASGISMVILETLILSRNGRTLLPPTLRANLAKITAVALAVYLVVRFQDLIGRGDLHYMLAWNYHTIAFYFEVLVGFVCPLALLMFNGVRQSRRGLYCVCIMVLCGFAANRMNTAITGMEIYPTRTYFPSLIEILIMLGIAAVGFSAFAIIAGYLPIFKPEPVPPQITDEPWIRMLAPEEHG